MIRIGTLCYVIGDCLASPEAQAAVCRIVEVVSLPYDAPDPTYLPGTYYDVAFEGWVFYCRSDKLRPISDPDAQREEQLEEHGGDAEQRETAIESNTAIEDRRSKIAIGSLGALLQIGQRLPIADVRSSNRFSARLVLPT